MTTWKQDVSVPFRWEVEVETSNGPKILYVDADNQEEAANKIMTTMATKQCMVRLGGTEPWIGPFTYPVLASPQEADAIPDKEEDKTPWGI